MTKKYAPGLYATDVMPNWLLVRLDEASSRKFGPDEVDWLIIDPSGYVTRHKTNDDEYPFVALWDPHPVTITTQKIEPPTPTIEAGDVVTLEHADGSKYVDLTVEGHDPRTGADGLLVQVIKGSDVRFYLDFLLKQGWRVTSINKETLDIPVAFE